MAALVGPYFVDWGSWRADFEREASRVLGRPVAVRGEATARLLPFPSVTFTDVEVQGTTPDHPAMTMDTFSMDLELAPLLRGEVLIFDMRIVRPRAFLSVDGDGVLDLAIRPSTPFDPHQIMLEKVTVTDGSVTLHHAASGRDHELTAINAAVSAQSLAGPWRLDGSMLVDGMKTALAISTGAADETGRMRLRVRADPEPYAFTLETDGDARIVDGAPTYDGSFKLAARTESPAADAAAGEGTQPRLGVKAVPAYRVNGRFALDHSRVKVEEFRFETGPLEDPYTAEGHAEIGFGAEPRFSIVADGAQIRFDEAQGGGQQPGMALAARLAAFRAGMMGLPTPLIPGTLEVGLPAIVAGDTTIRDVTLSAEPVAGGWSVGSMSAKLPGRTVLEGSGLLRTGDENFGFAGNLLLAVGQPSGFAAWLSQDVDDAIRRLPSAGFSAKVDLSERRQVIDDLELVLGDAQFRGRALYRRPLEGRPTMLVELDGGRLDVEGLAAFASLFVSDARGTRLAGHDLDFEIKAGPVVAGGVEAETLDTALRLRDGLLEIDRLSIGGLAGGALSATGTVRGIGGAMSGSLDASLVAADLSPLLGVLAARFPGNAALAALDRRAAAFPGLFDDADVDAVVSISPRGGEHDLAVSAQGKAGGTEFTLAVSAGGTPAQPYDARLEAHLTARNSEPAALFALYGLPALPFGFAGAAQTELNIEGPLSEGARTSFSVMAEGLDARYEGTLLARTDGIGGEGAVSIKADDLEPWLMTAGMSLPGMGLGLPVELKASANLDSGLLVLSGLEGRLAGNRIDGDLNAQIREGLVHLTGSLDLDELDLALPAAAVLGPTALQSESGEWPQAPFQQSATPPFTAEIEIAAQRLDFGAMASAQNARLIAEINHEGMRVSGLDAEYEGGQLGGLFELRNTDGTGLFSAQMQLDDVPAERLLPETGLHGVAHLTATLSSSGKSVDGVVAALAGSGSATVDGLAVDGLNPDALPALLARADEDGVNVNAERTARFAPDFVRGGSFKADKTEIAASIASGVLRAPPVRLEGPAAILTAELRADFVPRRMSATGTLAYRPGADAIVGAEPAVRFSAEKSPGAVRASLDTEPLAQFLTQRALEREQARVEAMQALLLERQRLRREVQYYAALQEERHRKAEEERLRLEEEARRAAEEQAARERAAAAAEAARRQAEEAARMPAIPPLPQPAPSGLPAEIERAPLPAPPGTGAQSSGSSFNADSIEQLLQSLQ